MATVVAVCLNEQRKFGKLSRPEIRLAAGHGVEGDVHAGATVQHLSRKKAYPDIPNLRQVHLIHEELFAELAGKGFDIAPGQMGENITTRGIDLLGLPRGALLHIGADAVLEVTGLRNPCRQLDGLRKGLMAATLEKQGDGAMLRKTGIMSVVLEGGAVHAGDDIRVELPNRPFEPLPIL